LMCNHMRKLMCQVFFFLYPAVEKKQKKIEEQYVSHAH